MNRRIRRKTSMGANCILMILASLGLVLAANPFPAEAQEFSWVKQGIDLAVPTNVTPGHLIAVDDRGNGISCGVNSVSKHDGAGNPIWTRVVGGSVSMSSVGLDASGSVHIVGSFTGTADFDPGPGVETLTVAPGVQQDSFVLKL